mmetsp:Transcript_15616/g.24698  ORF Transcript_15616/g.24698 Transcript_15616/m.24698 type:complete len:737 (-) Transcript_15616:472-2682(-)
MSPTPVPLWHCALLSLLAVSAAYAYTQQQINDWERDDVENWLREAKLSEKGIHYVLDERKINDGDELLYLRHQATNKQKMLDGFAKHSDMQKFDTFFDQLMSSMTSDADDDVDEVDEDEPQELQPQPQPETQPQAQPQPEDDDSIITGLVYKLQQYCRTGQHPVCLCLSSLPRDSQSQSHSHSIYDHGAESESNAVSEFRNQPVDERQEQEEEEKEEGEGEEEQEEEEEEEEENHEQHEKEEDDEQEDEDDDDVRLEIERAAKRDTEQDQQSEEEVEVEAEAEAESESESEVEPEKKKVGKSELQVKYSTNDVVMNEQELRQEIEFTILNEEPLSSVVHLKWCAIDLGDEYCSEQTYSSISKTVRTSILTNIEYDFEIYDEEHKYSTWRLRGFSYEKPDKAFYFSGILVNASLDSDKLHDSTLAAASGANFDYLIAIKLSNEVHESQRQRLHCDSSISKVDQHLIQLICLLNIIETSTDQNDKLMAEKIRSVLLSKYSANTVEVSQKIDANSFGSIAPSSGSSFVSSATLLCLCVIVLAGGMVVAYRHKFTFANLGASLLWRQRLSRSKASNEENTTFDSITIDKALEPEQGTELNVKSTHSNSNSAEEFLLRIFKELGTPSFVTSKHIQSLKDDYITTVEQLEEFDDGDWKRYGFQPKHVAVIKKKLHEEAGTEQAEVAAQREQDGDDDDSELTLSDDGWNNGPERRGKHSERSGDDNNKDRVNNNESMTDFDDF